MKRHLLMGVAIAAMLAGADFALAQAQPDMNRNAPSMQGNAPGTPNAPAEKIAPPGEKAPAPAAKGAAEQKSAPANQRAQSTTKTAPNSAAQSGGTNTKMDDKADTRSRSNAAQDTPKADTQPGSRAQSGRDQSGSRTDVNVNLTAEQRTRIHDVVVKQSNAPRVARVDFSLNVGAVVPSRVRVVALPPAIMEIHPAWRGYMYFLAGDQIVIVEPGTLRIVEILAA